MGMKNNSTSERFRNRKEALTWLQARGQISQGKFYTDCTAGLLIIYPDKSLSKFQVAEYAEKIFGFVRQGQQLKGAKRIHKRTLSPSAQFSDSWQGLTIGPPLNDDDITDNKNVFGALDVTLKFNTAARDLDDQEPDRGTVRLNAVLNITFTGDMQRMRAGLHDIGREQIAVVVAGLLKRG